MIRHLALAMGLLTSVLLHAPAFAVQPDEMLANPELESRARGLSAHFRCLVCQNQSIDDSDAPLARDLRILIREQLTQGKSDDEVTSFVVERYGDFVLLKPPFRGTTLLLWLAPFALLASAAFMLWRKSPGVSATPKGDPLSQDEEARLAAILRQENGN
jgi:cytochrome c-type biogenesis protein CcmH